MKIKIPVIFRETATGESQTGTSVAIGGSRPTMSGFKLATLVSVGFFCGLVVMEANELPSDSNVTRPAGTFEQPFAADSCWNSPVPADAKYADCREQWKKLAIQSPGIAADRWTVGFYRATGEDPEVKILLQKPGLWEKVNKGEVKNWGNSPEVEAALRDTVLPGPTCDQPYYASPATMAHQSLKNEYRSHIRCPRNARPSPDSDGHFAILLEDGKTVFEAYCAVVLANGDIACALAAFYNIDRTGDGTATGLRASMLPAIGGLIRQDELERGRIDHALSFLVYRGCMDWGSHVWPAISHDKNSDYSGTIPMGARLAIRREVDLSKAGLSSKGLVIARALQKYGMYLVDRGGEGMTLQAELGYAAADPSRQYREWWGQDGPRILALLQWVLPPSEGPRAIQLAPDLTETGGIKVNPPSEPLLKVGPDQQYPDIATALAALPDTGGTVLVTSGTYNIRESLRIPGNTALLGEGSDRSRIQLAADVLAHVITNADQSRGNHNILIRNLAIVGNLDSRGTPPRGKKVQGNDHCRGIYLNKVQDAWIEGCFISEAGTNSIRCDSCQRVGIVNNVEKWCFHCLNFTASENCLMVKNRVIRKWSGEAPYFNNTHHSQIIANTVEGMGMDGMTLDFSSSYNRLIGNTIIGSYLSGIFLSNQASHNTVLENTVRNNGQYRQNPNHRLDGIHLNKASGNLIRHNWLVDDQPKPTQRYGIYIAGPECQANVLEKNFFSGNAAGDICDKSGTAASPANMP